MKTINYTGSSKLISRIVNLLNRRAPLPLDGDGDPDWGTNGQVLSTDGTGNTAWVNAGGGGDSVSWTQDVTTGTKIAEIDINGTTTDVYAPSAGSGGHTIENTSGTDLPQEDNLQFVGVYTRDDSTNNRTEVNIVRQMTKAAMEALSSAEQEGFIDTTDEPDQYVPMDSEDVKYVNTTVKAKLDALTTDVSGKVSKSGDTMTGTLNIKNVAEALIINRQNSSGWSGWLGFYNQSGLLGRFGVSADKKPFFQDSTERQLATWDDLLLKYATPFFMTGAQGTKIRFTFTGLSNYESIHLLIFGRYSSADILAVCSSTGFSSLKTAHITEDTTYNMGTTYTPNNGYTFTVQVGTWSTVWGLFIHPYYPNATMTMARET